MKLRYSIPLMFAASFTLLACFKPQTLAQKMEPMDEAGHNENYTLKTNPYLYFNAIHDKKDIIYPKGTSRNLAFDASQSRPSLSVEDMIVNELIYNALFSRTPKSYLAYPHSGFVKTIPQDHYEAFRHADQYFLANPLKEFNCDIRGVYNNDYKAAYTFSVKNSHTHRQYICSKDEKLYHLFLTSRQESKETSSVLLTIVGAFKDGNALKFKTDENLQFELFDYLESRIDSSWHKMGLGFRKINGDYEWVNKTILDGRVDYVEVTPHPNSTHKAQIEELKKNL